MTLPYPKYSEDDIKNNVLAIYELDTIHRKDLCPLISCDENKKFIRNYEKMHSCITINEGDAIPDTLYTTNKSKLVENTENQKITITFDEENSNYSLECQLGFNYKVYTTDNDSLNNYIYNNLTFVQSLDNLFEDAFTYQEHNQILPEYKRQTGILNGTEAGYLQRSTHLYKGLKDFLVEEKHKNKTTGKINVGETIQLPYYNSTSTNIYKGCYYSSNPGVKGHILIITPENNVKCIDYISFINAKRDSPLYNHIYCAHNKGHDSFIRLLQSNKVDVSQFDFKKKYIYEQEVLFQRYTALTSITYIGTITHIINGKNIYYNNGKNIVKVYETAKKAFLKTKPNTYFDPDLFINDSGELYNYYINGDLAKRIITKTYGYFGFGGGGRFETQNIFNQDGTKNFNSIYNLDPINSIDFTLMNTIGTYVYTCGLDYGKMGETSLIKPQILAGGTNNNLVDNNLYYQKYLKYKMKYLELKKN
jgi:hypothetical protein